MKLVTRIAAAALIGLGIGAVDAAAQNAPAPQAPAQTQTRPALAPLTADQIKTVIAGRLVQMRSDLKVGKVVEKDADTYDVELLKADGTVSEHALVDKLHARPAGALSHHERHGRQGFGPENCPMGMGGHPGMGPGMMQR
ncbi:MAG TPA: hypothetical protein VK196_09470 [Magnetospirillum sp.]|nr:hypothetical protein [Magnetospirillum sp.]